MKRHPFVLLVSLATLLIGSAIVGGAAHAATRCEMRFDLKGWAAFYEKTDGTGAVTCDNGQSATVKLEGRGGGISAGKWEINDGRGYFSGVDDIHQIFGDYASTGASAGAGGAAGAHAMTKGPVSLSLRGKGRGVDLSAGFGRFRIEPLGPPRG